MIRDLRTIVWRESRDFRRQIAGHVGLFLFFAFAGGILAPNSYFRSQPLSSENDWMLDGIALLTAFVYAGLISESSFFEERSNGTMQTLLSTALRPLAMFLGKWLWMMAQATIMIIVIFVCHRVVELTFRSSAWPASRPGPGSLAWAVFVMFFAWSLCSFVVASNAVLSLVVPNTGLGRLASALFLAVPFLGAYGFHTLFGVEWDRGMMFYVGGLCIVLSLVAFLSACVAFRSERTRLWL